jgi:hypothetical protein
MPSELNGPEFPFLLEHIWLDFLDMSTMRQVTEVGYMSILPQLDTWCKVMGRVLSLFEVYCIKELDKIYLRVSNGGNTIKNRP